MSYILEALRRAQAERERQGVPGLQAQPYADLPAPQPRGRGLALALTGGLLLGASILAGLWWWSPWPASPRPGQAAPGAEAAASEVAATALPPQPPAVAAPVPQVRLPMVVSAPPSASPQPPAASVAVPPTMAAPAPAVGPSPSASAAGPRLLRLAQLPAEQRRELPPLVIGGSVWSDSAASRFVIVDGQLLREGESLAPGLVLERILPKAAWLRWRELRIELAL